MEEVNVDSMEGSLEISAKDEDYESGGDSAYATIQVNPCIFWVFDDYPVLNSFLKEVPCTDGKILYFKDFGWKFSEAGDEQSHENGTPNG